MNNLPFDLPKNQSNVIKVIGVGGGGSNAINHMFQQGIKGVDFIVCNTDAQALENSPVPNKIQLGVTLTEGLGAGANPSVGQKSAEESVLEIEKMLDSNTKMIFITAGMGGGTGTGAAPVIAQLAKQRDILTVGIVTIPFQFEGKVRVEQALIGIENLRKQVDSLIVVNNNKLREVYGNLGYKSGFSKADEVLATASRGIAEVITHHYTQNIDLKDAKTVLSNSGTAIMGSAVATGENRAKEAIIGALDSPLLNDNKITGAKNVLLLIVSGTNEITIDEIGEINEHIQAEAGHNANIIMGVGEDEKHGEGISVTIIATGFNAEQQNDIVNTEPRKIIHSLEEDQKLVHDLTQKTIVYPSNPTFEKNAESTATVASEKIVFSLLDEAEAPKEVKQINENELVLMNEFIKNINVNFEIVSPIKNSEFQTSSPEKKIEFEITNQKLFDFDVPQNAAENTTVFELNDATRDLHVVEPIQFVSVTEQSETGFIRHTLEEYMEMENSLISSKPAINTEVIDETLNFILKEVEAPTTPKYPTHDAVSSTEITNEQSLKAGANDRRHTMKQFNHKFKNSPSQIDELEKIPAYKRLGINVDETNSSSNTSRMSLGTDSNNDAQLRNNNSYLHDNVD